VPASASLSDATAFAESVAGVLDRHAGDSPERALDELGWGSLAEDPKLFACAGLGGVELGRRLAPLREVDRLLGCAPLAGELVRSLGAERVVLALEDDVVVRRTVIRAEPVASSGGIEVHRVLELGDVVDTCGIAPNAWMAATVGYLAGLGQGALDLTVDYVRQRRAFGTTLAALGPVQQHLAGAATAVRGVRLLAGEEPDADALAHAGPAVAEACAACHQVTGAIGFTLEYPLHGYTQRARALAAWNDALLDELIQPPAIAR
jgi:butyryl-CoA dehydrogenase